MTQLELARRLEELTGRTKALDKENVRRWEKGEVMPSGDIILALLRLCPDTDSLAKFGLDIDKLREQYPSSQVPREGIKEETLMPRPAASDRKVEVKHPQKRRFHADERLRPGFRINRDEPDL
jgi:transcriptional regulator with XRE-family HTH domain